jgi:hypothetical protein
VADHNKFGNIPNAGPGGLRCDDWEALLADALDGRLPATQSDAFHAHSAACAGCADLLEHAKQGQEWLEFLHAEPEIPAGLVGKILDKTVGVGAVPVPVVAAAGAPVATATAAAIPWRRSFHETRLLMTVAMAFFSIALTLNMVGVRVTNLRLADLRPSNIGSTLSRNFYGARSSVVRFYDNMRFVYQLESRVRELRRDVAPAPQPQNQKKQQPAGNSNDKDGQLNPGPAQGDVLNVHTSAKSTISLEQAAIQTTENGPTEVLDLNSLGIYRAGPRQDIAGYEERSLA